ncbi:C-X-C chemokine receptor type 5 [Myripristis murdjan]|uniref:C-X-C motif chemokine receptor 5 n=1 Tax=Myripristis murdjan TaxID=586833 RepID=A0A667XH74_9TELE|nr:C-X-C chemokine receptor type 5 [Myripristis murdjan]
MDATFYGTIYLGDLGGEGEPENYSYENGSGFIPVVDGVDYVCGHETVSMRIFREVFHPLVYSLVFFLGVAGNGLMMTVLLRRGRLRITEIYLLHLALADLLLLFTIPFSIVENLAEWVFGEFLCKLVGLLTDLNLLCGSLLLACIGFDRYLAIVHAIPAMHSRRPKTVHLTCMVLWLFCLGISLPNVVFLSVNGDHPGPRTCFLHNYGINAHNWLLTSRFFTHVLCFFLPLAVMSYCYTAVIVTLRHSQKGQEKQSAIRLALLVTLVFCLCWLPYNITITVDTMGSLKVISNQSCEAAERLDQAIVVTKSLGVSHCCLNPFLYAFVGVRFRNDLVQLLSKWGCGRVCLPFITAQGHARPSVSEGVTTTSTI